MTTLNCRMDSYHLLFRVKIDNCLTDWIYPTNLLHRFFKVTVEMP